MSKCYIVQQVIGYRYSIYEGVLDYGCCTGYFPSSSRIPVRVLVSGMTTSMAGWMAIDHFGIVVVHSAHN